MPLLSSHPNDLVSDDGYKNLSDFRRRDHCMDLKYVFKTNPLFFMEHERYVRLCTSLPPPPSAHWPSRTSFCNPRTVRARIFIFPITCSVGLLVHGTPSCQSNTRNLAQFSARRTIIERSLSTGESGLPVCLQELGGNWCDMATRRLSPSGGKSRRMWWTSSATPIHSGGRLALSSCTACPTQRRTWNWQICCSNYKASATGL